ncbi:hypothetical protein ETB97_001746, partial [Aspergillus alliaceus]
ACIVTAPSQEVPLLLNLLIFFLPLASADRAFRDYKSADDVLDRVDLLSTSLKKSDHKSIDIVHFKPEILNMPVFRPRDEQNIATATGRSRGADAFGKMFTALGHRAGYPDNITVRACRRSALMETDKNHSETAHIKFSGQLKRDIYGKSYVYRVAEVDGAASFLGIVSRHDHIENNCSMGARRNPRLYQCLPAKEKLKFQDREDIVRLDTDIQSLKTRLMGLNTAEVRPIQQRQRHLETQRQRLYLEELARL